MTEKPINIFAIQSATGHNCCVMYEDHQVAEAVLAVHKWGSQGIVKANEELDATIQIRECGKKPHLTRNHPMD